MSSVQNVLNSPELLEQILLQVDMRTLLTSAQRVSQAWHRMVYKSPLLQQHLFLLPALKSTKKTKNPLLAEKFPHWFCSPNDTDDLSALGFGPSDLESYDIARQGRNESYHFKEASWRKMLPRQPPIRSFICCKFTSTMCSEYTTLSFVSEDCIIHGSKRDRDNVDVTKQQTDTEASPIRMQRLYNLITQGAGDRHTFLFAWDTDRKNAIPLELSYHKIQADIKKTLDNSVRRDGLVLFECSTQQCTQSSPWKFKHKFIMME
ncbi:hypothetical protein GGI43DRAFT_419052 [Trichoderma evansii]